ncbi:MAG: hypothetical protein EOP50_11050 [Sphingobacteriales bacterium]|nr:MAG: hypothetical protein EOP50_11050 [Sphingobacteriales bacterium]
MTIGLIKEPSHETRVSLLAEAVATLTKKGITVLVEDNAGEKAFCSNADYEKAGAQIKTRLEVITGSQVLLAINTPETAIAFPQGQVLIGVFQPLYNPVLMKEWAAEKLTVFSLDMLPRTTRAQSMDVLSSQANIAGYKSVLVAANSYGRYFPMFMTAAGSIAPAKVLILGAGVAGGGRRLSDQALRAETPLRSAETGAVHPQGEPCQAEDCRQRVFQDDSPQQQSHAPPTAGAPRQGGQAGQHDPADRRERHW